MKKLINKKHLVVFSAFAIFVACALAFVLSTNFANADTAKKDNPQMNKIELPAEATSNANFTITFNTHGKVLKGYWGDDLHDGWSISLTEEYKSKACFTFEYYNGTYMVGICDPNGEGYYYLWYLDSPSEFLDYVKLNDIVQSYFYYGLFHDNMNNVELFYTNEQPPSPGTKISTTWDPNGGSWDGSTEPIQDSQTYADLISYPTTPTKEGWDFAGWETPSGKILNKNEGFVEHSDCTLKAVWKKLCYVSYDNNGGAGTIQPQQFEADVEGQLDYGQAFTRQGKCLDCWNTAADGSGTRYSLGAKVTLSEDMTLYAQWVDPSTATVTFNYEEGADLISHKSEKVFTPGSQYKTPDGNRFVVTLNYGAVENEYVIVIYTLSGASTVNLDIFYFAVYSDAYIYKVTVNGTVLTPSAPTVTISSDTENLIDITYGSQYAPAPDAQIPSKFVGPSGEFDINQQYLTPWKLPPLETGNIDGLHLKWFDPAGKEIIPGDRFEIVPPSEEPIECDYGYFGWLNYDPNGGQGTFEPLEIAQNAIVPVYQGDDFTKDGCILTGWNTAPDGSGQAYALTDELTFTRDTTLYAQWQEIPVVPGGDVQEVDGTAQTGDTNAAAVILAFSLLALASCTLVLRTRKTH